MMTRQSIQSRTIHTVLFRGFTSTTIQDCSIRQSSPCSMNFTQVNLTSPAELFVADIVKVVYQYQLCSCEVSYPHPTALQISFTPL